MPSVRGKIKLSMGIRPEFRSWTEDLCDAYCCCINPCCSVQYGTSYLPVLYGRNRKLCLGNKWQGKTESSYRRYSSWGFDSFPPGGSGSGIRCLFDSWIRDPGWVKIRIRLREPDPGWTTRIILPRAYKHIYGLKYLNSLKRGSGIEKNRIRDPG